MSGRDPHGQDQPDGHDPAEIWGRRIGRGLGAVALLVLAWLLGRQLHLW
ncbi:hypothetical protein [Methylobacterium frigidaeris]|uniref:Uncharacterized protein n=1 Tax=Methylobacterium frigidaeris TaxID=2038277 RepID=A0AA37HC10_9HYPH|nr:hypothetical protein [Methylobacterium frigidaeris]GJD63136.1 hypothetical protein MPEAHAMD_3298 [Methylobacterium frigidaeris]